MNDKFNMLQIGRGLTEKQLRTLDLEDFPVCQALRESVFFYETQMIEEGRRGRAVRTWQGIGKQGFICAADRSVCKKDARVGFTLLKDSGYVKHTYEWVIIHNPHLFSAEAVKQSLIRLRG